MKQFIMLTATPASGKSTWAKIYQEKHPDTIILSSDEIRFEITGTYLDFSKQEQVWELFGKRIVEYSNMDKNFTLILDALNDLNSIRQKYVRLAKNFDKKILVAIKRSFEEICKSNKERREDKWVPDDVLLSLYNKYEEPDKETIEMFDEYQVIDYHF